MTALLAWLLRNWRLAALAGAAVALAGAAWIVVDRVKETGRRQVIIEINRTNEEATDAARRAREAHDLACAHRAPDCLSNPWDRDRDR